MSESEFEQNCAYADYQNSTSASAIDKESYDYIRHNNDDEDYLVKVVSNDLIEACHFIDTSGELVKWYIKYNDEYFEFVDSRNLSANMISKYLLSETKINTLQNILNDLDSFLQEDSDYMTSPLRKKVLSELPEEMKIIR